MKWFSSPRLDQITTADWIDKNVLKVTLGSNIESGDILYIDIKVAPNVDIYPGTVGVRNE